ncbi:MAG: tyrosine-type recombinase/integrase [Cyanobacteria bacterium J06633_8]
MLSIEVLQQIVANSELGQEWINDPLMSQDVWAFTDLGYSEEDCTINNKRNLYFNDISLSWLKLLIKLTIKASAREKHCLGTLKERVIYLKQFNNFLNEKGYTKPELLTDALLQEFIHKGNQKARRKVIAHAVKLWSEEQWLKLTFTCPKYKSNTPKIETIPEEVLAQIYQNFDLFPPPLERLFRLQIVLGCRIGEILKMPRQCLKKEEDNWFLLRWVGKRKHWQFSRIHPLVAELIQEQQNFLDHQFNNNLVFDKLFCRLSTAMCDGVSPGGRFNVEPIYIPESLGELSIQRWLRAFGEKANLRDKYGNRFKLKSHQFRRTKASIMAYLETEDEYIAAILGHSSLDMLPHYRNRSLEKLEKEALNKSYVDMYGRVTSFKPRKRRYEKLAELLKVDTSLGECHRPTMLGDCQYRYACLNCDHHRVSLEDKPKLEADIKLLLKDLEQANKLGKERRVTEINRLLELLNTRLQALNKLANIHGQFY